MLAERAFMASSGLLLLLAGCPAQNMVAGDVPLGEYEVQATKVSDDCVIGGAVQDGDFAFRARLSGDSITGKVYLVVSVPPAYAASPAVSGQIEGESLIFTGESATPLPACDCSPLVGERFAFTPLVATDGGAADAGVTDGGSADAGVADAGPADGGLGDAGAALSTLPALEDIVGLGGSLDYTVGTVVTCKTRDVDAGTGCTLPCKIHYLLDGSRISTTP